jgi:hypothetical protein
MEKFVVRKMWALIDDPTPYNYNAYSVFEKVRDAACLTQMREIGVFADESEARKCYAISKPQARIYDVWSGDRRKFHADVIVLEKDIYEDGVSIDRSETLEWFAMPCEPPESKF